MDGSCCQTYTWLEVSNLISPMDPYYLLLNPILTSLPEAGPYSSNYVYLQQECINSGMPYT